MRTEIGVVRGATEKEVKSGKFNIYVGISLGNKWFTKENIKQHVLWALKYTKEKVGLLVADTLHAINYEVRNKDKPEKALVRAIKKGDEMVVILKEIIGEFPKEERDKIEIIRWDDVKADEFSKKAIPVLYEEFRINKNFKNQILEIVRGFSESSDRLSDEQIGKLARYILDELPELLHGFTHKNVYYNCYTYPYDGLLTSMVEKIQKKELFSHLHKKLDIKTNVFVELRVI